MDIKFIEENEEIVKIDEKEITKEFINLFINTKLNKYLSYDELTIILTSKLTTPINDILIKYLVNNITICNSNVYIYNEDINIHYRLSNSIDENEFLTTYLLKFVEKSINKLNKEKNHLLKNIILLNTQTKIY